MLDAPSLPRQSRLDPFIGIYHLPVRCGPRPIQHGLDALSSKPTGFRLFYPDRRKSAQHVGLLNGVNRQSANGGEGMMLLTAQPSTHGRWITPIWQCVARIEKASRLLKLGRCPLVLVPLGKGIAALSGHFARRARSFTRLRERHE
jgi:hypothetical protein